MRVCEICKKGSMIQKSGAHQYGGGWAMRATKKRVVFKVNLHSVKVVYLPAGRQGQGRRQTMRLCTKCLRRVKSQSQSEESKSKEQEKEEKLITPIIKESSRVVSV